MAEHAGRRITFREMTADDLDDVMTNESLGYTYPWTRGVFLDCLKAGHDCRVLCMDGEICGHAIMSSAAGEAHLLNVCVRSDRQGIGLGRLFVRYVLRRAQVLGAETMFLEVRPSNMAAVALYDSLGFVEVGRRREYYPGDLGREDALVLALKLEGM